MNNIKKIIEYGLYLLVFILPIQTRLIIKGGELNGGYWEYGTISLYMTDILLIILLLLFIINLFLKPKITNPEVSGLRITNYWWIIGALELFIFISIFFAPDKILAIYRYGVILLGIGLFWLIVRANYNKTKLYFSLLAGILLQAILGIWQFLTQFGFSINYLGMAVHRAEELGTSVIETIGADGLGERWLRAYGGLPHPNILGGVLAVGILLVAIIFLKTDEENNQTQNSSPRAEKLKTYFLVMCYVLCVMCLFFTFSRAAWLGLLAELVVIFVMFVLKKELGGQKKFLQLILAGGILVFLLFNLYGNLVNTRISANAPLEVKSNNERIESYKIAKEIIKKNWLFGVGIGNYTLAVRDETVNDKKSLYYQPTHNVFLLVWAEIGIFGLLSFLSLLLITGYRLLKNFKNKENFNSYKIALLTALIVISIFDHWLWSLHFGVLFFWLAMGLALREK
jgi:O-antigen ligase